MEKLWTTNEVARYLGIQEVDVEELVRQGTLTGYRLGGQFLRFRPDQVEALKGKIQFRPQVGKTPARPSVSWWRRMQDVVYFYDFYLVSGALLALLLVYLVVVAG